MEIQIFLASSINEFSQDRLKVGDFVNRLNKIYHKKDLFFALEKCEDVNEAIHLGGKQSQYDDVIRISDFMFLLFGKSVGAYTSVERNNLELETVIMLYTFAMQDLSELSAKVANTQNTEIECSKGTMHLNLSMVFWKKKYLGINTYKSAWEGYSITLTPLVDGKVICADEVTAHSNKSIEIFEKLYKINPEKYIANFAMVYLADAELMKREGLIDEAIVKFQKVERLCAFLSQDIDPNSPIYRHYIGCELHLANVYKTFEPLKAMPYYEKALEICSQLATSITALLVMPKPYSINWFPNVISQTKKETGLK